MYIKETVAVAAFFIFCAGFVVGMIFITLVRVYGI